MDLGIILYTCICFLLVMSGGCKNNSETLRLLGVAESMMESHPDSAYVLLKNMDAGHLSGKQEKALYALLYTQGQYKNYEVIKKDSLINIAVEYYAKRNDDKRRADALMYQGCVLSELKDYGNAIDSYKQAESIYQKIEEFKSIALINTRLGEVHSKADTDDSLVIAYTKKAIDYYKLANDSLCECRMLAILGAEYSLLNTDSAFYYLNLAKKRVIAYEDKKTSELADYVLMDLFNQQGKYNQAKQIGLSKIYQEQITPKILTKLCYTYLYSNQIDSAKHIYSQIEKQITQISQYNLQTEILFAEGNYKEAFGWLKKTTQFADSLVNSENKATLLMADRRFDYQKILSEKKQAESTLKTYILIIVGLALLACIVALIAIRSLNYKYKYKLREQLSFIEQLKAELLKSAENDQRMLNKIEQYSDKGKSAKAAIGRRLQMLQELFDASYQYGTSDAGFLREAKRILDTNRISAEVITDVCEIINHHNLQVIDRLKTAHPVLSQSDLYYLSLLIAGFSPAVIALLFNYASPQTVYVRKARIGRKLKLNLPLEKYIESFIHAGMG